MFPTGRTRGADRTRTAAARVAAHGRRAAPSRKVAARVGPTNTPTSTNWARTVTGSAHPVAVAAPSTVRTIGRTQAAERTRTARPARPSAVRSRRAAARATRISTHPRANWFWGSGCRRREAEARANTVRMTGRIPAAVRIPTTRAAVRLAGPSRKAAARVGRTNTTRPPPWDRTEAGTPAEAEARPSMPRLIGRSPAVGRTRTTRAAAR